MSTAGGGAAEGEMQIWWKVWPGDKAPREVEVMRETEHYLVLPPAGTLWASHPRRVKKHSRGEHYFREEQAAWDWLIERAQAKHEATKARAREAALHLSELRAAYRQRMGRLHRLGDSGEVGRG